jgi:hypothetical protein
VVGESVRIPWRKAIVARALIIAEEESLITADRTAGGKPKLVVNGVRLGLREHVARGSRVISRVAA